jgi:integrase
MPNYKGKRPGTRRVILWSQGKRQEWVIEGSKRDGDEFEARKRLELRVKSGPSERRVAVHFFALCEEYAVHAKAHLKDSTWRVRIFQIDALTTYLGSVRLPELNAGKIDAYKTARLEDGLVASSVNNELRVLRSVLNWASSVGHDVPPVKWKRLPERGKPRARAFSAAELSRIFRACQEHAPTFEPLLVFLLNTGCRQGEAIAAEWSWMDMRAKMIRIPSNEHWQPKDGEPREVPMSDAVVALLSGKRQHERFVFPTVYGRQFRHFPKELWERVVAKAGLTGGAHQLRHTFASHFLESTSDLFLLGKVLGHSHERVTEIYAHLLPGHLDRARNAVNIGPPEKTVGRHRGTPKKKKTKTAKKKPLRQTAPVAQLETEEGVPAANCG